MILNKDVLVNNIVTELSDNSTGQISPYDIRHNLLDIIDSVPLLTRGYPLDGPNFGTLNYRTTKAGDDTLTTIGLAGHISRDNTAIGHSALKVNFQGVQNTAIGSQSLFCNVYGENNVSLGYSALAGNTIGDCNVGLGNFTLHNNKSGRLNIAIGHGAGYYIKDQNSKLVISSHNIDSDFICANPLGSGLVPLIQGDLHPSTLKVGIAVPSLHNEGVLQVGGRVSPSLTSSYDLGSSNFRWRNLYLSTTLLFSPNKYIQNGFESNIDIGGNLDIDGGIFPSQTNTYNIGSPNNLWNNAYFNNIYASGIATFNRVVAYETCNVYCKSIDLATSGSISLDGGGTDSIYDYANEPPPNVVQCGHFSDNELAGAGFNINALGEDYFRTYSFTFAPPQTISCSQTIDPYALASWNSNISLHISNEAHLKTSRIIFPSSINLVQQNDCLGIFSRDSGIFFSKENVILNQNPSSYLAGVGDVNFYSASGSVDDHIISFAAIESGVTIKQRFLNGVKTKTVDPLNNNLDKLTGFEIQYINDANGIVYGPSANRLVIGSYDNTSLPVNAISLMQGSQDEGLLCLTNMSPTSQNLLPATTLNIRSANNAIARLTAENQASTKSAIQLVGKLNCLANGFEAEYLNNSGIANLNMYKDFVKTSHVRFYENNTIGLFNGSGQSNAMVTIGSNQFKNAVISFMENSGNVPASSGYGKVYISPKIAPKQSHTTFLIDGSGNKHDLVINPLDVTDGRGLYTDASGNTFGGLFCPDRRDDIIFVPTSINFTVTIASPAVFTANGHNLKAGDSIKLSTTGSLPTGLNTTTTYYVISDGLSANNFRLSTSLGGSAVNTSGFQSGTHLLTTISSDPTSTGNTGIGSGVLFQINGGNFNSVFGTDSARSITIGSKNTIIGAYNASGIISGSGNIVIGCNSFNAASGNVSHSIIIGNDLDQNFGSNNNFIIGNSGVILLSGRIGPTNADKFLSMPSGGSFSVYNITNAHATTLKSKQIELQDYTGNNYPSESLEFSFKGQQNANLLLLNHSSNPMSNTPVYESPPQSRPYAQLNGDIRLRGAIRFSDSSSLDSSDFLQDIQQAQSDIDGIENILSSLLVEGYVMSPISAPSNPNLPTQGILQVRNSNWVVTNEVALSNRDTTSSIHQGAYVIAIKINNEYRPLWISAKDTSCECCNK